jgi:hypothetical protein
MGQIAQKCTGKEFAHEMAMWAETVRREGDAGVLGMGLEQGMEEGMADGDQIGDGPGLQSGDQAYPR